jgi:hypothetical protein
MTSHAALLRDVNPPGNDIDGASMSPKQHRWSIDVV